MELAEEPPQALRATAAPQAAAAVRNARREIFFISVSSFRAVCVLSLIHICVGGKFGVQQPVILDGPRDVVILLHRGAIGGPAVAAVIAVSYTHLSNFRHLLQSNVDRVRFAVAVCHQQMLGADRKSVV